MPDTITLIKDNPLLPAEDYEALRKKGFNYIEQSGSAIWTDYNNSDPGITMLEAVCYAITDIAYRTGFEIKDLLAPEHLTADTWKEIFYTAKQILHNAPLTINDYRKLIIDIKGVRNAWIEKSKDYEVPLWIDYNYPDKRKEDDCACEDASEKTCFGKLGLSAIDASAYKQDFQNRLTEVSNELNNLPVNATDEDKAPLQAQIKNLQWQISQLPDDASKLVAAKIVELEGLYNVTIAYEEDILQQPDQRAQVRLQVIDKLSRNRNLCEDFLSVNAAEYEDIGIRASVVLEEYADPDVVLSQIFFIIYKYFTPSIPFYTIQQMLEKGFSVDEIFEGPALKHGFIDDADLEKTDLFRDIRLSDIISEIADIQGVKAITYLHLLFDDMDDTQNTSAQSYFKEWVKYLQEERRIAQIIPEKSQVLFCKEREVISYYAGRADDRRPNRMLKLFKDLKTIESKYKLVGQQTDFPIPAGEFMDLEDYYPVTYSLPVCYGVSERAGLPADADAKRKVQALQLKGYLHFFEQLLSGYLAQLNHLKDLFSFDDSVRHNFFVRAFYTPAELNKDMNETQLKEMEDLKTLLIDHENRGDGHWDKILQDFSSVLQNLLETPTQFYQRRNRLLNHLLARFSEDMSEYEAICRWLTPDGVEERLISDKIRMLKGGEYYKISTQRGKAFDYTQLPVWDTSNVSGAERRVSRLLGMADATRHTLAPSNIIIEASDTTKNSNKNIIKLLDPDDNGTVLLTSAEVKDGCCTELLISQILEYAEDWHYYKFVNGARQRRGKYDKSMGPFWFELYDSTDENVAVLLASSEQFETEKERQVAYDKVKKMQAALNSTEGLHLVEHLLLRPKLDEVLDEANAETPVGFLNVCLNACDLGIGLNEETDVPAYRKKISRIPQAKCYDKMPWILEYFKMPVTEGDASLLFRQAFADGSEAAPLKFRRYELLAQRVRDLQEFGSERINYEIVSNMEEQDNIDDTKYSFLIHGDKEIILAQSDFIFTKRTKKQIEDNAPVPADDIDVAIADLMSYFGFQLDLYCEEDACDNNEDPYSFRMTVILPCWTKRFRNPTFRNLAEKTIETEFPAHLHTRIVWVGVQEMKAFEEVYENWLDEMAQNEMPRYEIVNPLIEKLNTLQPCSACDDSCGE